MDDTYSYASLPNAQAHNHVAQSFYLPAWDLMPTRRFQEHLLGFRCSSVTISASQSSIHRAPAQNPQNITQMNAQAAWQVLLYMPFQN